MKIEPIGYILEPDLIRIKFSEADRKVMKLRLET